VSSSIIGAPGGAGRRSFLWSGAPRQARRTAGFCFPFVITVSLEVPLSLLYALSGDEGLPRRRRRGSGSGGAN